MPVRAIEGKKPYKGGIAIEITEDKVINLRLRGENNLIEYDEGDNEIYVDLQLDDEITPTDELPVGITTGRIIVDNGWDFTGTIIVAKTTSGDLIKFVYADDGKFYIDNGTGTLKQIYLKSDIDTLINALKVEIKAYVDEHDTVVSDTAPSDAYQGQLWYDTTTNKLKSYDGTQWNEIAGGVTYSAGSGINISQNNEISNALPGPVVASSAPSNPVEGTLWYDTTNDVLKSYDGTQWNQVGVEYTAGQNVQISAQNVISATDSTYIAGDGVSVTQIYDYSAMQGPCSSGFHVPTSTEFQTLVTTVNSMTYSHSRYLLMPMAGYRNKTASTQLQSMEGYYWTCSVNGTRSYDVQVRGTYTLQMSSDDRGFGYSIRPFKDTPVIPDGNWTTLCSGSVAGAGIFHNASSGLISISNDGVNWITIADKNLGASTIWNDGDTLSEANCGYYFQRGNNYGFPRTGNITNIETHSVNASNYGPGNYYSSSWWVRQNSWDSSNNTNLRGGVTGVIATSQSTISNTGVISVNGTAGNVTVNDVKIGSSAPANPTQGMLWYDTTNNVLKIYDGTNWNTVGGTTYTASTGINISANNEISVDTSVVATQNDISVISGDSGTTYTIKVSNTAPAAGTPNTTLTFVY